MTLSEELREIAEKLVKLADAADFGKGLRRQIADLAIRANELSEAARR